MSAPPNPRPPGRNINNGPDSSDRPCYGNPDPWDLDCIGDNEALIRTATYRCAIECPFFASCNKSVIDRAVGGDPPRNVIEGGLVWSATGRPLNANLTFQLSQSAKGTARAKSRSRQSVQAVAPIDVPRAAS